MLYVKSAFISVHLRVSAVLYCSKDQKKLKSLYSYYAKRNRLGLNPTLEKDKAYPKSWWKVSGRVLVDMKGVKSGIVGEIVKRIGQNPKS